MQRIAQSINQHFYGPAPLNYCSTNNCLIPLKFEVCPALISSVCSVRYLGSDDDAGSGLFGIDLRRGLFMAGVCSNTTFKQG